MNEVFQLKANQGKTLVEFGPEKTSNPCVTTTFDFVRQESDPGQARTQRSQKQNPAFVPGTYEQWIGMVTYSSL